jgi:hypothetical protein
MKMQLENVCERLSGSVFEIFFAALLQKGEVDLLVGSSKNLPGHFNGTIRHYFLVRWWSSVGQGQAQGPPTQDIPILDAGRSLQPDQLLFRLRR